MNDRSYRYYALDRHVLLVAVYNEIDWSCYIGAVPGVCHAEEYMSVAESGSKVSHWMARPYFSDIDNSLPWRD